MFRKNTRSMDGIFKTDSPIIVHFIPTFQLKQNFHNNNGDGPSLDMELSDGRGQGRKNNFEDVDDMKVEKVEIAFDKIEIPVQPPKKKKKKKKLL